MELSQEAPSTFARQLSGLIRTPTTAVMNLLALAAILAIAVPLVI